MTGQHTPKSHLHSFLFISIIGSSITNSISVIKTIGARLFLLLNPPNFNINCFFWVGARESLVGCILGNIIFFQHGLKESNNNLRITESKQKLKTS
jgi:hypothetical protein